ncbi:hypothetical protein LOAG_19137 [Loa loa]|uniref:Uncharacterized protein n=1 Tax=Loa loa TaxID=7209 RepID=A0A1S0UDE4_LOALO|nr:hypothetical protein LOAG_19137 [Loa loa]EJD73441.1 hypothetical protein LOAG_19137 [Loa loa]
MGILNHCHGPVVLAIVISNDLKYTDEGIKSEALTVADEIRKLVRDVPICIVAQSDNRNKENKVLIFHGSDVNASTLVVDKNNSETLRTKFENWKRKELRYLSSHQLIAFHFTVVNGTEPEDSEEIFSNTFPDIPLSTLRLLDESSMTGVDHGNRFHPGSMYAIVGFRKFGGEVLPGKMFEI